MPADTVNHAHRHSPGHDGINEYRQHYRRTNIPQTYSGYRHLLVNFGGGLLVCVICLLLLDQVSWAEALVLPVTFVYANLVEYIGHRWVMHRLIRWLRVVFERHTRQHHRFFTCDEIHFDGSRDYHAVLFPPLMIGFFFGVFGIPIMALIAWLWSFDAALLTMIAAVVYYLVYEAAHFVCHMHDDSWPHRFVWVRYLVRHHRMHHAPALMSHYHFNFAIPLGDILFGTCYKKADWTQAPDNPEAANHEIGY